MGKRKKSLPWGPVLPQTSPWVNCCVLLSPKKAARGEPSLGPFEKRLSITNNSKPRDLRGWRGKRGGKDEIVDFIIEKMTEKGRPTPDRRSLLNYLNRSNRQQ